MWPLIEADFHQVYGIELDAVFRARSWRWFTVRVAGLLGCESRLNKYFYPPVAEPETSTEPQGDD